MKLTHIKGIDSIRALGIILVVIYHFYTSFLPGGFFGVDVFFVISGFLVTSLLVKEYRENGEIDLIKFYVRRVRRLLPSAAFMVVVTLSLSLLIPGDLRVGMREQTAAVFGWVTNYFEILMGASYEDQFIPHLFVHTWALGIEMHYYLIWGAVMTVFYLAYKKYSSRILEMNNFIYGMDRKLVSDKIILFVICLVFALVTYIRMQLRFAGLDEPSPVYYATFTRLYPLMIGSALGAMTGMRAPKETLPVFISVPGLVLSLLLIVRMSFVFSFSAPATYHFGILAASVLVVISIICVLSLQGKKYFTDLPPLAYIGKRSYNIYLFHWPLYHIFRQMSLNGVWPFSQNTPHYVYTICAVGLTMIFAEISYRVFEQRRTAPAEKEAQPEETFKRHLPHSAIIRRKARALARFTAIIFCIFTIISAYALVTVPPRTNTVTDYMHQKTLMNISKMDGYNEFLSGLQLSPVAFHGRQELLPPTPSEIEAARNTDSDAEQTEQNAINAYNRDDPLGPIQPLAPPGGAEVTVIGDSVPLGAAEIIQQTLGSVVVDAEVSRTMGAGASIITEYVNRGELGEFVVLALFTNPIRNFEDATNAAIAAIPPGHRVIAVTPFGYDYMEETAEMVRRLPLWYDFVTVADWNAAIRDHTDLLAPDGIHMKGNDSRQLYANLLAAAIEQASRKPAKQ